MDKQTERELDKIREELRDLRKRMDLLLSRYGGYVEGQISLAGVLQLVSQATADTPAADCVRLQSREVGGVLQVTLLFPSGKTVSLGQDD